MALELPKSLSSQVAELESKYGKLQSDYRSLQRKYERLSDELERSARSFSSLYRYSVDFDSHTMAHYIRVTPKSYQHIVSDDMLRHAGRAVLDELEERIARQLARDIRSQVVDFLYK